MIPDNYDLFESRDRMQAKWLKNLPTCEYCGEAIQQERAVCIDGYWYCDECLERHKKEVIPYE